jgi:hypothetical protein
MDNIKGIATRAVKKLSEDIYASNTSFALELLQNGDDNIYNSEEVPYFRFRMGTDYVFCENNEVIPAKFFFL